MPEKNTDGNVENENNTDSNAGNENNEGFYFDAWIVSLNALSVIQDAFELEEKQTLIGKKILDVGTNGPMSVYISLKFEPDLIIGINDGFNELAAEIEQNSKLFTNPIKFYNYSFFDKNKIDEILKKEGIKKFDFVLVSRTLHHLRTGKCKCNHVCRSDEKDCVYEFEVEEIFDRLLELGKRIIIYEHFAPREDDDDKIRGRGCYFTIDELEDMFETLLEKYKINLVSPEKKLAENLDDISKILRKVDCICFYVEEKEDPL